MNLDHYLISRCTKRPQFSLIEEIYTFLKQADSRELGGLFRQLDEAKAAGDAVTTHRILHRIDAHETHVVPIIADG